MKSYSEHLALDFSVFINSLQHIKIFGGIRIENFLLNFQNIIDPTCNYVVNTLPYVISPVTKNKSKQMLVDLERIKSQSISALNILRNSNYESERMERMIFMLEVLKDESDKFIKYINNTLKNGNH